MLFFKKNYYILLIVFFTIKPFFTIGQIQEYTTENGLPSNGIKGMQWDEKTGFLWIATEAGLVRFNGADFRLYNQENTPSIESERLQLITRNNAGHIYIADMEGNIFTIEKSKPLLWKLGDKIKNPNFKNYFLLSVADTFFNIKININSNIPFSLSTDKFASISDTSCIILHNSNLYRFSTTVPSPSIINIYENKINTLFKINNNIYFITVENKIYLLNQNNTPQEIGIQNEIGNSFNDLNTPRRNLFWENGMPNPILINKEKAFIFYLKNNNLVAKEICSNVPSDAYIRSIQYSEKNKTLFIATDSKGLIIINQPKVQSKKRENANSKNRNAYYAQIDLGNGSILTNEGDIINSSNKINSILPIQGKFDFNISWTNDSLLWYTQLEEKYKYNCLHQYNKSNNKTTIYNKINSANVVVSLNKTIYLANSFGIGKLDVDSLKYLYRYAKAGNITFQMQSYDSIYLTIATCAGLFNFNTVSNTLDTLFAKNNMCVRSIWKYKEYLFFGTYGDGFYILKNGKVKQMPLDKKSYLKYTHCFIPDDDGFCWISTNRGLFKANIEELINAYEHNIDIVYYHYYGKKDGMEMTELNGGCAPCAIQLMNKTISFPTMDGLLWVNPNESKPIMPEGEIFIDEIQVDNKNWSVDAFTKNSLPPTTQEIKLLLGFSAWCNKENIYLEYQLNDTLLWKPVNTDNETLIQLNNLPSGDYVLRIRKINGFGINNFAYKEIKFTIKTPWYKKWWFYLFCILGIIGFTAIFLKFRTKQYKIRQQKLEKQVEEKTKELIEKNEVLEKNNSIKTRLISIISHDIITPLKFLNVAGKNLMEKRKLMSEELQQETIYEITNTSKELQLLSTNILNWIKYQNENRRLTKEKFNVHDMVNQIKGILKSMAHQKQIEIINEVQSDLEIEQFFEPLKILIYNLVTNAIHFSEKNNIVISSSKHHQKITLRVKDNGIGMTKEQIQNIMADQFIISSTNVDNKKGNGLGYLIIKDLAKMTQSEIKIESEKGKGTTVSILFETT